MSKFRQDMALTLDKAAPVAGLAGPLVKIATIVIVALHNPAYSPIVLSTSKLELMSIGWLSRLGSIILSLCLIVFFIGLSADVLKGRRLSLYITLLLPLLWILSAIFPDNPVGALHSIHGMIHGVAGLGIVMCFTAICFLLARAFRSNQRWPGFYNYSIAAGFIEIVVLIVRIFLPYNLNWFGLYELVVLGNGAVWFEAVALRYLLINRKKYSVGVS